LIPNSITAPAQAPASTGKLERGVFIAWHAYSRRAQLLSEKFGLRPHLISVLKRRYALAPLRYALQAWQTLAILRRERPRVIFVQTPPVFAPAVVMLYAGLVGARVVIDAHSGARLAPWWRWSLPLQAWLSRRAVTTIVTNEHLQAQVRAWGAHSLIVADIPTTFPEGIPPPASQRFTVVVINTFSPDEPLEAVIAAAASLPEVQFFVTGDPIRAKAGLLAQCPPNVQFTGFLPDANYIGLLRSADGIMALTTHDHTMQRGACEAVSLGRPIITSDWPLLRDYFDKGTVHVDNSAAGIRAGVVQLQAEHGRLLDEISELQAERRVEWREKQAALVALVEDEAA
jgi:glycosyltransferase involved in cell wall biosynthesis